MRSTAASAVTRIGRRDGAAGAGATRTGGRRGGAVVAEGRNCGSHFCSPLRFSVEAVAVGFRSASSAARSSSVGRDVGATAAISGSVSGSKPKRAGRYGT